jgi:hypothetical protein
MKCQYITKINKLEAEFAILQARPHFTFHTLLLASGEKQTGTLVNNRVAWEQITEVYGGSTVQG